MRDKVQYAQDDTESVSLLLKLRIPPLILGLILGFFLSFVTSRFEEVLSQNVAVVFFIPLVVYIAAAVGEQTQIIYIRDLKTGRANFKKYLLKETALGLLLGIIFGLITYFAVMLWLGSSSLAFAISLSTLLAIATAPLIGLIVSEVLKIEHTDPAVTSGPIATVIQDVVSILIYGFVCSLVLL